MWCLMPGIVVGGESVGLGLVAQSPCWICFMCLFCILLDSGKCFMMFAEVIPWNVRRLPLQTAASKVFLVRKCSAAWR